MSLIIISKTPVPSNEVDYSKVGLCFIFWSFHHHRHHEMVVFASLLYCFGSAWFGPFFGVFLCFDGFCCFPVLKEIRFYIRIHGASCILINKCHQTQYTNIYECKHILISKNNEMRTPVLYIFSGMKNILLFALFYLCERRGRKGTSLEFGGSKRKKKGQAEGHT